MQGQIELDRTAATVAFYQQVVTYYHLAYRMMALSYSYSHALPLAATVAFYQQVINREYRNSFSYDDPLLFLLNLTINLLIVL